MSPITHHKENYLNMEVLGREPWKPSLTYMKSMQTTLKIPVERKESNTKKTALTQRIRKINRGRKHEGEMASKHCHFQCSLARVQ